MSSEYDRYFQKFLGDDSNEFDIFFRDDANGEPEGQHRSDEWQLQHRAVSISSPTLLEDLSDRSSTFDTANSALAEEMLPETEFQNGGAFGITPSVVVLHSTQSQSMASLSNTSSNVAFGSTCLWISCATRNATRDEAELAAHLEAHWKETLKQWIGPRGCDWPDCTSRATFKSPSSLKSHIFNIHVTPLICTYPQCTYSKPFGKACDLRRHTDTAHKASRSYICPVESCEANIKGFSRKDKLLNHLKEQHDNLRCPYNHCYATVLETEQDAHLQEVHDSYECALGACEKAPASRFTELRLQRHFRTHHNATSDPVKSVMAQVSRTGDHTARSSHITQMKTWKDCRDCSEERGYL